MTEEESYVLDTQNLSISKNQAKEKNSDESDKDELKNILAGVSPESPISSILFKGKYQVLLLNDFMSWQHEPLSRHMEKSFAVCGAQRKKDLYTESNSGEGFSVMDETNYSTREGCGPLPLPFDSTLQIECEKSICPSAFKQLSEAHFLHPIAENIGREMVSLFDSIDVKDLKHTSFVTLCYGNDPKQLVLQGSARKQKKSHFRIISQGSVSKKDQLPRLGVLKSTHLQSFPPSFSSIETSVFARYDFLENECESLLTPVKSANLFVECTWNNTSVTSILEPLPNDCTCAAKIKSVLGDEESGASHKFKEIKLIQALQQSLETGWMTWPNSTADGDVMKKLKDFLNEEKSNLFKRGKPPAVLPGFESFEKVVLNERSNLDFTEKLWLILKDCSSYEELVGAFTFVYNSLNEFLDIPFVSLKNMSTVAVSLKNAESGQVVCPPMDQKRAIQYLLEIGVEKLRKDYAAFFPNLGLTSLDCISKFLLSPVLSSDAVTSLKKLHSVLEVAIICVQRLLLPKEPLSVFVRNALKYYSSVADIDPEHEFSVKIPAAKARQLLDQMRPTIWEISLLSSNNGYLKQSVHHYQTTPTHEHIYAPKNYHPTYLLKTASYVYLTAVLIQDDLFV